MTESDNQLSKQDLYILMESYKNNIQLNTTLLEQQKQLLVLHETATNKQKELCDNIDDLIDKLSSCSKTIFDNQVKLDTNVLIVSNKISLENSNLSKEHSTISKQIYVAMVGMATIIISIIGMAISYSSKFNEISDILLKHIVKGG
jgi:hypothetical protein